MVMYMLNTITLCKDPIRGWGKEEVSPHLL